MPQRTQTTTTTTTEDRDEGGGRRFLFWINQYRMYDSMEKDDFGHSNNQNEKVIYSNTKIQVSYKRWMDQILLLLHASAKNPNPIFVIIIIIVIIMNEIFESECYDNAKLQYKETNHPQQQPQQ